MDLIEQKEKLDVRYKCRCIDGKKNQQDTVRYYLTIRAILVGPRGSGKTNIMYNLITHVNGLKFENIYLFSKTSN